MKAPLFLSCLLAGAQLCSYWSDAVADKLTTPLPAASLHRRSGAGMPESPVRIIIDKSDYELSVYDAEGWYATYPVVFGNSNQGDKMFEGDRRTPEGTFKILSKRVHDKWDRYMGLNYPTAECMTRFNQRKQRGEIPSRATPGGGIGIHGTWPGSDYVVDRYNNWTEGCISLKNKDVEELYSYIPVGTEVVIKK